MCFIFADRHFQETNIIRIRPEVAIVIVRLLTAHLGLPWSVSSLTRRNTGSSVTMEDTVAIHIARAEIHDADTVATMVGELLHDIMTAVNDKAFGFDHADTVGRARAWMKEGLYTVLLATLDSKPVGFFSLYESYALYTEGAYGTIPEFYVRSPHRSHGIGSALLAEAKQIGQTRGWKRLEVTTPPLPQFDRTLNFYQRNGFTISGGRKLKLTL
jgi:GNAT superfamily N-acetyltransferase